MSYDDPYQQQPPQYPYQQPGYQQPGYQQPGYYPPPGTGGPSRVKGWPPPAWCSATSSPH